VSFGGSVGFAGFTVDIPTATFGGSISAGTAGEIGLDAVYRDFSTGEISVEYPIEATFTVPKRDTFRETETITIGSDFRLQPGWSLGTVPADLGALDLVGRFGFSSFVNVEVCVFVCSGTFPIAPPINIPSGFPTGPAASATLFTLDSGERIVLDPLVLAQGIIDAPDTDPLRAALTSVVGSTLTDFLWTDGKALGVSALATYIANFTILGNFNGHMGLPSVQTTDSLDANGQSLNAIGTDNYINMNIDLDGLLGEVIGGPSLEFTLYPLCVGGICTSFGYNILDIETVLKMFQTEQYQLNPIPRVRFDLPTVVEFTINGCSETNPLNFIDPSNPIFPGAFNKTVVRGEIPLTYPENVVVCSGKSDTIVFDLGHSVDIVYPLGSHLIDVTPTFLLPNLFSSDTSNRFEQSLVTTAISAFFNLSSFEIIPSFTLLPGFCIDLGPFGGEQCTPEVRFPGLSSPGLNLSMGPLFSNTLPLFDINTADMFDGNQIAWPLGGLNTVTRSPFRLDAEVQPTAIIDGPATLNEGQNGTYDCLDSVEVDIGEGLICRWDFGDGITATGPTVVHSYDDNGPVPSLEYAITLVVDDGHVITDIATKVVTVYNVTPTLSAGSNKTVDEGSPVGLGIDLFGRNLITNPNAESGTTGWSTNQLTTDTYAAPGSASPQNVVLVNDSTQGYYNSAVARLLDGTAPFFAANNPTKVTLYQGTNYSGSSLTVTGNISCLTSKTISGGGTWNDKASSIKVPSGLTATLYKHCGSPTGYSLTFGGTDEPNLGSHSADNDISRVVISGSFNPADPTVTLTSAPDLSAASGVLGSWLTNPGAAIGSGDWSSLQSIPQTWNFRAEDAIIYAIDGGEGGITDVRGNFAVDNGVIVYVNGVWKFGRVQPGGSPKWEYSDIDLGNLPPGISYIQIIRSDSGGARSWDNLITGTVRGGRPASDSPGPLTRENKYFRGGSNASSGSASQGFDVSEGAELIDDGATFTLSGYLGGFDTQTDGAVLTATFRPSNGGASLGSQSIGKVTASQRTNVTGLQFKTLSGGVPSGTRWIDIGLSTDRQAGFDSDGYADRLFFAMFAPAGANLNDAGRADTHTAIINWGDATAIDAAFVNQEPGSATFLAYHTYVDDDSNPSTPSTNDPYTVLVTADDDDHADLNNGQISDSIQITVLNVAPIVMGQDSVFVVGEGGNRLLATFDDPGILDTHTASITWGDGQTTAATVLNKRVTATHTYNVTGPFPKDVFASLTVTDKDGGATTVPLRHTIVDVKIQSVSAGANRSIIEGGTVTPIGSFKSIAIPASPITLRYEYEWDYGDFTSHGPIDLGVKADNTNFSGLNAPSHGYGDDGQFEATLTVRAYSTRSGKLVTVGIDSFQVTVTNAAPTIEAGAGRTTTEGATASLNPTTFGDVGVDDTHTATINWGDGSPTEAGIVNEGAHTVTGGHVYADDGSYTVVTVVCDDDGLCVSDSFVYTVTNVAPVVGVAAIAAVTEGDIVTVAATFTDVGSADTHTATIDWDDGDPEPGNLNQPGGTVSGTHTYDDNGSFTINVEVCDDEGLCSDNEIVLTVNNALPVVFAGGDKNLQEGEEIDLGATFSDAGEADTHGASIDWGDHPSPDIPEIATVDQDLDTVSGSHVYAQDGTYTVTVTVCDDDFGCGNDALTITVSNVPTEIVSLELTSIGTGLPEGSTISLDVDFSDKGTLDSHTGTVDWGDGSAVENGTITETPFGPPGSAEGASGSMAASHTYADNGDYTITISLSDDDSQTGDTASASVSNVAPTVTTGGNRNIDEGDTVTVAATYSDPGFDSASAGTVENVTSTIDWGDGTTEPGSDITLTKVPGSAGTPTTGAVGASHVYGDDGDYTVTVCVADDDHSPNSADPILGEGCDTFLVTVANVAPVIEAGGDKLTLEGASVTLGPATFFDPGFDVPAAGTAEDFTATVDWGDGTTEPIGDIILGENTGSETSLTTGTVQAIHFYGDNGTYTVEICVTDDNGGSHCDTLTVEVFNVAPSVEAGEDQVTNEGTFITLDPATSTDPGFDNLANGTQENFSATIDWGDGNFEPEADITLIETPGAEEVLTAITIQATYAYGDNGTYTVTVCVTDDDEATTCDTLEVVVNNVAPSVEAGANQTTNEGTFITLDPATYTDPGFDNLALDVPTEATQENFETTIDWGDGNFEPEGDITLTETPGAEGVLTGGTVQATHAYGDNGTYTVTVCVTDDNGGTTCDTLTVTVLNVAPSVDAGENQTTNEGTFITLDPATYTDPGFDNLALDVPSEATQENFTTTIDWGDGNFEPEGDITLTETPGAEGVLTGGTVQATHAYGDNGTYTVTVCVTDDNGGTTCDTLEVVVNNVAPSVEAGENQTTNEGTFITLDPATYTDPGFDNLALDVPSEATQENFTATIDWGDGNFEPVPVTSLLDGITVIEVPGAEGVQTTGTVQATHAYGDNGTYTVTVCVTDDDGATTCDTLEVVVNNVAPSVEAGPDRTINESDTVFVGPPPATGDHAAATYSDTGFDNLALDVPSEATQENFTSTIDWGEGTVDVGVLTEAPGAEGVLTTGTVSGSHVYGDDGPYTVTVCVTDDDEATTCDTFEVTVNNVAPVFDNTTFLGTAITFTSGDDAFLGRKGVLQTHSVSASDVGSDDLRYDWAFPGTPDRFGDTLPASPEIESTTTYNDGSAPATAPFTDPARDTEAGAHPHGIFPFFSGDFAEVTFNAPGIYTVQVTVTDDNGGTDYQELWKLVTDDCECTKSQGYWSNEIRKAAEGKVNGRKTDDNTMQAYLDIVDFASSIFGELAPAATFAEATLVMKPTGADVGDPTVDNMKGKAVKQALAAWLNFAKGAVIWDEIVPTGQTFAQAMEQVEAIILDPDSTHADYVEAKNIAEAINLMDKDNQDCVDEDNDESEEQSEAGSEEEGGGNADANGNGKGKGNKK
jgi:hypothetical protein